MVLDWDKFEGEAVNLIIQSKIQSKTIIPCLLNQDKAINRKAKRAIFD